MKAFLPCAVPDPTLLYRPLCRHFVPDHCNLLDTLLCKQINKNTKSEGQKCVIFGPEKLSSKDTRFCRHLIHGYEGRKATEYSRWELSTAFLHSWLQVPPTVTWWSTSLEYIFLSERLKQPTNTAITNEISLITAEKKQWSYFPDTKQY